MGRVNAELGEKVYLDTNIIIYAVEGFVELEDQIHALLQAIDDAEIIAVTSELAVAEVLVKPLKDQNRKVQQAYKTFLTPTFALQIVPITLAVLEDAAYLCAMTKLKLPDAIHLATAKISGCDCLLTNDILFKSVDVSNIRILSEIALF
ncbi:MAG: type II toxin-antitoxin system VapC family toxin [Pyrinomonadaceae bacterium]